MPTLTNPYTAGDPVGKTAFFVGRVDVLREVERLLRHPTQNAVTLYGQRRIGKTSILQYLEAHLPESKLYIPIYFDLMHKAGLPLAEILRDLARTISLKLNLPDGGLEATTEKTFRETYLPGVLRTLPVQVSLVLLLDEFDVLTDPQADQQSKRQFFSYLRDLRQLDPQHLQFVFVLGRNVDDLDVIAQGLFKDLPSQRVSLLAQKDAEALVRLSERQNSLPWSAEAVARVWELTSGHPYLTQALCSQIWEDAREASDQPAAVQPQDVESAIAGALERSQNMFAWLWDGLGPAEKVVAAALAGVGPTVVDEDRLANILAESGVRILIGELQNAPKILEKWDILAPVNGGHRFRVELLRRWIAENHPLSRTQDELDRINPVANSLFNAASGYYQGNDLKQAESLLRQALDNNPNHLRANELLAEILLSRNSLDEAQILLERLEEIIPGKSRYRLKQVYLKRAESASKDAEKLEWYEKILSFFPTDPQAYEAKKQVYISIGEQALQALDFQTAIASFQEAGDIERYENAFFLCREYELETGFKEINELEKNKFFQDAYIYAHKLAKKYPAEHNWQVSLDRLQKKAVLKHKYDLAVDALERGKLTKTKKLLAEVIAIEPDYEQASRYLYLAVTGDDPHKLKEALAEEKAQGFIVAKNLNSEINKLNLEINKLNKALKEEMTKSLQKANIEPTQLQPKSLTTQSIRKLSLWNPLDYLRLFWWVCINEDHLLLYQQFYGKDGTQPIGKRLGHVLNFFPLLLPALGFHLGLMGANKLDRDIVLPWTLAGIATYLIMILFGGLNEKNDNSILFFIVFIGLMSILFNIFEISSMVFNVVIFNIVAIADASSRSNNVVSSSLFILVLVLSILLPLKINKGVILPNSITAAPGYFAVFFTLFFWITSIWTGLTFVISGGVAGVIAYIIGSVVLIILIILIIALVFLSDKIKNSFYIAPRGYSKVHYWFPISLGISWLTLAFLSFGGLVWLQTGIWPTPSWPF